jgi:diadenylate cyclase
MEEEKAFLEYLKKVSPGTSLRTVLDDLIRSELGALIVFEAPEIEKAFEGGFRINCRFSPERLFELCKMDGAIIVSADLKRILYANVLLTPDTTIHTNETGTRHKAGERTAKQTGAFVIAISERRKKISLYYKGTRYFLKSSEELLREISGAIQVLEKQRESLEELIARLNVLELSGMASVRDVCKIIQSTEIMLKISESIKRNFTEVGKVGNIMNMRYKELIKGVEKMEENILRDYAKLSLKKIKTLLSNLSYDGLLELETIARLVFEQGTEENTSPRGYRFLNGLSLGQKDISAIVEGYASLNEILEDKTGKIEEVLKNRTSGIKEEIEHLRTQILEGKVVF